ncbi:MAG: helix-turn-helix domain-containing protein [Nostoc sp. S4]|nr:helix-turn-helix domain-containing protein [Nostoc sp. S4]
MNNTTNRLKNHTSNTISFIATSKFLTQFQRQNLEKSLHENLPELYYQRIQIMLLADRGKSQTEICKTLGCSSATARYWIYIARSGMVDRWRDCPMGRPKIISEEYLERLKELVNHSPRDYGYGFRQWTANWLQKHLAKELGIEISDRHIKQLLKQMGLSTRSHHQKTENSSENILKNKISISNIKSDCQSELMSGTSELLPLNFF